MRESGPLKRFLALPKSDHPQCDPYKHHNHHNQGQWTDYYAKSIAVDGILREVVKAAINDTLSNLANVGLTAVLVLRDIQGAEAINIATVYLLTIVTSYFSDLEKKLRS